KASLNLPREPLGLPAGLPLLARFPLPPVIACRFRCSSVSLSSFPDCLVVQKLSPNGSTWVFSSYFPLSFEELLIRSLAACLSEYAVDSVTRMNMDQYDDTFESEDNSPTVEEIEKRLRKLGCTEEQVSRHLDLLTRSRSQSSKQKRQRR